MFKVGDKVQWTSSAGGITRIKLGEVIEVVPAGTVPKSKVTDMGRPRSDVSYIVRAIAQGTETETRRLYWPHVSKLQAAGEAQATP